MGVDALYTEYPYFLRFLCVPSLRKPAAFFFTSSISFSNIRHIRDSPTSASLFTIFLITYLKAKREGKYYLAFCISLTVIRYIIQ